MKTVADVLTQTLHEAGIRVAFGLPGGENVEVLEALRRHDIQFVLVRNENSAVYMADVTARLTGKPGVCLTTLGPGATNAIAGVAHAYLDRAPVLIITAQSNDGLVSRHTHQMIDLQTIFGPITKQTSKLTAVGTCRAVGEALALTMAGRPGPVHLGVSNETAAQPIEPTLDNDEVVSNNAPSSATGVAAARELLGQAIRPVIVVGLGLEPEKPYDALQVLAEAINAPVIVTPKAKGSLAEDHPLAVGTIGLTRTDPAYEILAEADVVIAIGFDVVELVKPWDSPVPLIWLAPWPNEDPKIAAEVELVGPMKPALEELTRSQFATSSAWGQARVASFRAKLARQTLPPPRAGRMLPQAVLHAIRRSIPRDTLVTTDVGSHKILTALTWPNFTPNRYMVSNGLSAMGFGLPAAAAASLALNQPVICITGDAGLAMVMGELGLLKELGLPVITVVMNDSALDLIRSAQVRAGKPIYGTEFLNPDFSNIARAYGIDFYRVSSQDACAEAVKAAVATARPALIEAVIDPVSYPTTSSISQAPLP